MQKAAELAERVRAIQSAYQQWDGLGSLIREARVEVGLTQIALAQRVGVSNAYISDIEGGRRAGSVERLVEIVEAIERGGA